MIGLNSICYCHTLKMTAVKDYGLSPLPLLHSFKRGLNSKYFFSLQMVITIHDNCKMGTHPFFCQCFMHFFSAC